MVESKIDLMICKYCKNLEKREDGKYWCKLGKKNKEDVFSGSFIQKPIDLNDTCADFDLRDYANELKEYFEDIKSILKEYIEMNEDYYDIIALWILGTYLHKEFETFPYLFINAMRGSGKTRILKLIKELSYDGLMLLSPTEAVLFRTTGTLCIDEFEGIGRRDRNALRELLNAGYKKGLQVLRMKKKKTKDGEEQVVDSFEPYRPIVMANIWGMEEVLADRCITLVLEKSDNKNITRLIENFSTHPIIKKIKGLCELRCSLCSVVMHKNIYREWNEYVKETTSYTYNTYNTYTTQTTLQHLFDKINNTNIDGRNLELYFPLFLIAWFIDEKVLDNILRISKKIISEKKIDDITESKDVLLFSFSSKQNGDWFKVKELTNMFRNFIGDDEPDDERWLNTKWMGRALKRLNLVKEKRRVSEGIEVILNTEKAKEKMRMFS